MPLTIRYYTVFFLKSEIFRTNVSYRKLTKSKEVGENNSTWQMKNNKNSVPTNVTDLSTNK